MRLLENTKIKNFILSALTLAVAVVFVSYLSFLRQNMVPSKTERLPIFQQEDKLGTSRPWNTSSLTWAIATSSAEWEPRDSAVSFVFQDKIWTMGGLNGNKNVESNHYIKYWEAPHFNDIWTSEDGIKWNMAKEHAEWPERRSMSVVYFQNKLWMFGGWSPTSGYSSNIWQSSDGVTWTKVVESAPWPPREGQTAEVFQNKIWMVGGVNYDNRETKNDIWWSDDGIKWQEVKSKAPWSPRWDHALAVFKGKLFLSGGMNLNGETFKDVWSSGDGLNWELVNPAPPWRERQGHSLVVLNDKLWTIGSLPDMSKREINDVWYTDDGLTWQKTETDPRWIGREDHSVLVFKDRIFVFGGMDSNWRWKNDVWISSPANTDSDKNDSSLSLPMGSFISVLVTQDGEEKVLAQQDTDKKLPIASITKLMTALVASGEYRPDEVVTVSSNSLRVKGVSGVYRPGDELFFSDALRAMLVASHNELAEAMSERAGTSSFVKQMNEKKSAVRMINTEFVNPIGTDSDIKSDPINLSTAYDIYKLARYIEESRPDIFFITNTEEFNLSDANGNPLGIIKNTNKLLGRDDLPFKIIGGKTGETPRAKKNLVIVANAPCEGKIYSVILGSEDNFGDMEKLLRYSKSSHDWNCLPR